MFTIEIKPNPTTEKESPELTKDEAQLLDFCMELGLICWETFIKTPRTLAMFLLIPSDSQKQVVDDDASYANHIGYYTTFGNERKSPTRFK